MPFDPLRRLNVSLSRRLAKLEREGKTPLLLPPHLVHLATTPPREWPDEALEDYVEDFRRRHPKRYAYLMSKADREA